MAENLDHQLQVANLTGREKHVVATALAHAIATIDALQETLGGPFKWGAEDRADMQRLIEEMVTDDTEFESYLRIANWRVEHLVDGS